VTSNCPSDARARRTTLLGFGGAMVGFTLLFTILAFESAGGRNLDLDGSGSEAFDSTAMLSSPDGSVVVAHRDRHLGRSRMVHPRRSAHRCVLAGVEPVGPGCGQQRPRGRR
jgi:hypothetical protein